MKSDKNQYSIKRKLVLKLNEAIIIINKLKTIHYFVDYCCSKIVFTPTSIYFIHLIFYFSIIFLVFYT